MEQILDIDGYLKIIIGIIGAILSFSKLRDSFASLKRKQEIKLELEILEKLQSNNNLESLEIENKIKSRLKGAFEDRTENLTNFLIGIATFIGFGFWSIDLFNSNTGFNGWIILTLMCSLIGLGLIFGVNKRDDSKDVFYKIEFFDKRNFQFAIIVTLFTGILTSILFSKLEGTSFWVYLSGLFFLIGVGRLIRNTKGTRKKG